MRWLVPSLMFLVMLYPCATQAEPPTKPEDVLPYLAQVYKSGDIDGYADLLASDFKFVMEENDGNWDKTSDVKGTRALFEAAFVKLTISPGYSITPGPQSGTRVIKDVGIGLDVTQKKDKKLWHVANTMSFVIREEGGKMRIVEWRQKPNED